MNNRVIKELTRNPKAMMDFQFRGKLPTLNDSLSTPLREFLLNLPRCKQSQYRHIVIDNTLGFHGKLEFYNIFQLLRWLGHNRQVVNNQRLPYYSYINRGFRDEITIDLFEKCCKVT